VHDRRAPSARLPTIGAASAPRNRSLSADRPARACPPIAKDIAIPPATHYLCLMMTRKTSPTLTDGELRLMNVLWRRGPSTVLEIQEGLEEELVDSTIRTLLRILEEKGFVRRVKEGRAYRYRPLVGRDETRASAVQQVVRRFFRTPADLVLNLMDSGELDEAELVRIRRALELKKKGRS
jgi:predicted transcriptional regulator